MIKIAPDTEEANGDQIYNDSNQNEPIERYRFGFFSSLDVYSNRIVLDSFTQTINIPMGHISTINQNWGTIKKSTTSGDDHEFSPYDDNSEIIDTILTQKNSAKKRRKGTSVSDEIAKLAELREDGMITESEFDAFTEQFELSTGEKAREIVDAIFELHDEYEQGAMSEGNYHSALWSLMDKIDRDA